MGLFRRLLGLPAAPPGSEDVDSMSRIPMPTLEEIRELALSGRKIQAIKLYREASGAGLREAKEAVEQIVRETR